MDIIHKVVAILFFSKYAIYFTLNYFKLIHLQANMVSSFIFTYFADNHAKNCRACLKTQDLGHSLKVPVTCCILNSGGIPT